MTPTEKTAPVHHTPRRWFGYRAATLGAAAAAIIGIAAGPAMASHNSSTPAPAAKIAATAPAKPAAPRKPAPAKPAPAKPAPHRPAPVPHRAATRAFVPTRGQLMPRGSIGHQTSFATSAAQRANVAAIVKAGQDLKLPPRAMVMAVACAMQESTLRNLGNLGGHNDHDSLGLFQQRPSSGWGSPHQLTNPHYAATKFYKALMHVPGWQHMSLTRAVQKVQVSAFPMAYAKWEKFAASMVQGAYANAAHSAAHAVQAAQAAKAAGHK